MPTSLTVLLERRSTRAVLAMLLLAALLVTPGTSLAGSTVRAGHGQLQVTTSPRLDVQILVDGTPRNAAALAGLDLPVGTVRLCFGSVAGYVAPPCQDVTIGEGTTTTVTGRFEPAAMLVVRTEPAGAGGVISVDGVERDHGRVALPVVAGTHQVCFAAVPGWTTPSCRTVDVPAGTERTVTGTYTTTPDPTPPSPTSPGGEPTVPAPAPTPPSAPTQVVASHGDGQVEVRWTAANATAATVTGYRLVVAPGGRTIDVGADSRSATITGLTNGTRYRIAVRALSGSVTGPETVSNVVIPKPQPSAHGFRDVTRDHHFDGAVRWLRAEGITTGSGAGTFDPQGTVTRAQMAAFIWRMHDQPGGRAKHGFPDVPTSSYFDGAVRWLRAEGITGGTGPGGAYFDPASRVTRAQMAAFLWRSVGSPPGAAGHGFTDVPRGAYYEPAVRWLVQEEISLGSGAPGAYAPNRPVTRGQMAAFLHRMATRPSAWESARHVPDTVAF